MATLLPPDSSWQVSLNLYAILPLLQETTIRARWKFNHDRMEIRFSFFFFVDSSLLFFPQKLHAPLGIFSFWLCVSTSLLNSSREASLVARSYLLPIHLIKFKLLTSVLG